MNGIQILLLVGIAFITGYFITRIKNNFVDILFLLVLIVSAIIFILWPSLTNIIAHQLGVGRGADLITYLSILIFWFIVLKLYAKIRRLEQILTSLIRQDALNNAKEPALPLQDDKS